MKYKTVGLDPKLPAQAVVTVVAFILSYWGIDLTVEVAIAAATLVGFVAAYFAPAPKTTLVPKPPARDEGYTLVEVGLFLLLLAVAAAIVFAFLH